MGFNSGFKGLIIKYSLCTSKSPDFLQTASSVTITRGVYH